MGLLGRSDSDLHRRQLLISTGALNDFWKTIILMAA